MKTIAEMLETDNEINPWETSIRYAKVSLEEKIESCEAIMTEFKQSSVDQEKAIKNLESELEWQAEKLYDEFHAPVGDEFLKHQKIEAELETKKGIFEEFKKESLKARRLYTELKTRLETDKELSTIERMKTKDGFHEVFEIVKTEFAKNRTRITHDGIFDLMEKKLIDLYNVWHWDGGFSAFKKSHHEYLHRKK